MIWDKLYNICWLGLFGAAKALAKWRGSGKWLLAERLALPPEQKTDTIWFHCASLGEATGISGLLSRFRFPAYRLLLTASTRLGVSALECIGNDFFPGRFSAQAVPLDCRSFISVFAQRQRIRLLCLFEAEIWPGMLSACRSLGIPVLLVSAKSSRHSGLVGIFISFFYRRYWRQIDWVQAQDARQAGEISKHRRGTVAAGCDLKVAHYLRTGLEKPIFERSAFIFLSIHLKELRIIYPVLRELMRRRHIIVIPRFPSQFGGCFRILEPLGFRRFSDGAHSGHLLVDALGESRRFLRRSQSCFVGGSLIPKGGHNCWEPFLAGIPVLTGIWHFNQRGIVENLVAADLARIVHTAADLLKEPFPRVLPEKRDALLAMYRNRLEIAIGQIGRKFISAGISAVATEPVEPLSGG